MAKRIPEKRLAPTAPARMIAPAYQMNPDKSANTMAMILALRPTGLFGSRAIQKV